MAGNIKGITIEFRGDTTPLQKAIRTVESELSKTQKELGKINKALKFNPGNIDLWKQKQELLTSKVKETEEKLDSLKQAQKQMDASGVDKNSEEYRKLQRDIIETESKLKTFKAQLREIGSVSLRALGEQFKQVGDKMQRAGQSLTRNVTAPLGLAGGAALKMGMDFDTAMSQVAATMGTTVDQIDELREFAIDMGSTTAFSASQAAEGLNYMALAGYSAEESMAMLPTVLNLAAAGAMELGAASDMVTDTQSALGLSTAETVKLVDQMAKTASTTNTSVSQLGEAMLTVGGTAKMMKGGTQELSQVLGILADNGVKGSEGGTALRNILLSLSAPTDKAAKQLDALGVSVFDAEGNMRSMEDIITDLNGAMADMTDEEKTKAISTIFNKRDLKSVNALLGTTTDRWHEVAGAIDDAEGAAQQMADTQLDNLSGSLTLLKSALEGAAIAISDRLAPYVRKLADWITGLIDRFNNLSPETQDLIVKIGMIAAAIGPILLVGGKLVSGIGTLFVLGSKLIGIIGAVATALGPIGLIIAAAVAAGVALYKNWDVIKEKAQELWKKISEIFAAIRDWIVKHITESVQRTRAQLLALKTAFLTVFNAVKNFIVSVWTAIKNFVVNAVTGMVMRTRAQITALKNGVVTIFSAVKSFVSSVWTSIKNIISTVVGGIRNTVSSVFSSIKNTVSNVVGSIRNTISSVFNSIKNTVTNIWNGIKNAIVNPINSAKETISSAIEKIKSIINGAKLSLPKFKLPHFKINGGELPWGIGGKGHAPSISVDWYAKGGIFSSPSIIGVGEAGREAVVPLDKFWDKLDNIAAAPPVSAPVINIYATPGMDVNALAAKVEQVLVSQQRQRSKAYGTI